MRQFYRYVYEYHEDPCRFDISRLLQFHDMIKQIEKTAAIVLRTKQAEAVEHAEVETERIALTVKRMITMVVMDYIQQMLSCDIVTPNLLKSIYALGAVLAQYPDIWLSQISESLMKIGQRQPYEVDIGVLKRVLLWTLSRLLSII